MRHPDPTLDSENRPHRRLFFRRPAVVAIGVAAFAVITGVSTLTGWYYARFARKIDARLRIGAFADTVNIYAAPQTVAVGDAVTPEELVLRLRRAGLGASQHNPTGWYALRPGAVSIFPGPDSYSGLEPAEVRFSAAGIAGITALGNKAALEEYTLPPQLITNVSDDSRTRRRPVRYSEIPPALVDAVISAEDKHFFHHSGIDLLRIVKAAWVDIREGRKEQGASTLSMQLARGVWLDSNKTFARKAAELLMALHLETRLTKEQIFTYYSNQVYLGRRGAYNINGFGEAAEAYFGKEIGRLTVSEAATLAGMVQRPSYYNPLRHPGRVVERRNLVLALMQQNGYLTATAYAQAIAAPLVISPAGAAPGAIKAQYFVDLVNDDLQDRLADAAGSMRAVYTTLDPDLQSAAHAAIRIGMKRVDEQLARMHAGAPPNQPQVALIALDPHTGEVKALIGGRDYGTSQLDHVLAMRQPGSVFKPFVYAAALNTAVEGGSRTLTPASTVLDAATTFQFEGQAYAPNNFHQRFMGRVSLRKALARSLNVATVKLAQAVGFDKVVELARRCGMPDDLRPTPAIALGAYEASPLDVARAYTVFANDGMRVDPALVAMVRDRDGRVLYRHTAEPRRALDPRVVYLMVNLLEGVLRNGTGAGVRRLGFTAPAAGKTGTSRDGWFAGFTSGLLCIVWVGFDDGRDLNLEGAHSALPIWTEFMKRARELRAYRKTVEFKRPHGVVGVSLCDESGRIATPFCPGRRTEYFVDGSQPSSECPIHGLPEEVAGDVEVPLPPDSSAPPAAAAPAAVATPGPAGEASRTAEDPDHN